jgi:hypothetical protein
MSSVTLSKAVTVDMPQYGNQTEKDSIDYEIQCNQLSDHALQVQWPWSLTRPNINNNRDRQSI